MEEKKKTGSKRERPNNDTPRNKSTKRKLQKEEKTLELIQIPEFVIVRGTRFFEFPLNLSDFVVTIEKRIERLLYQTRKIRKWPKGLQKLGRLFIEQTKRGNDRTDHGCQVSFDLLKKSSKQDRGQIMKAKVEFYYTSGYSAKETATLLGKQYTRIKYLFDKLRERRSTFTVDKRTSKRKISKENSTKLLAEYQKKPREFDTLSALKEFGDENFAPPGEFICSDTTWRVFLKENRFVHGKTVKHLVNRNTPKVKEARRDYVLNFAQHQIAGYTFVFLDESGFKIGQDRTKVYKLKGEEKVRVQPLRGKNLSLICAVTDFEVLGATLVSGSVTSKFFQVFLQNLISLMDTRGFDLRKTAFVLDNAAIYKTKIIKATFVADLTFLYLSLYSPMLNPIENLFAEVKRTITKKLPENVASLGEEILLTVNMIPAAHFENYFTHMLSHLPACFESKNV
eukprot:CAMPEP_0115008844 /NCGR_PEP_ID=MMETSP0216-20121206/22195_1 /TAXON_ID=223996 /ORGANISM="Protocruzia adherens, Strain Boccale" /LENGTH=452 /DNA_ID=CAMNT_0002376411 /DNA_START=42 /DNA_END=1400 /DNA_ORIENTATION=+